MKKRMSFVLIPIMALGLYGSSATASMQEPFYQYAKVVVGDLHETEPAEIAVTEAQTPKTYEKALNQLKQTLISHQQQTTRLGSTDPELRQLQKTYQELLAAQLYLTNASLDSLHHKLSDQVFDQMYADTEQQIDSLYESWLEEGNNYLSSHKLLPNKDVVFWLYGTETVTHTVKKGESLSGIARKYRISVSSIQTWNGLKETTVKKGQVLNLYLNELPSEKASLYKVKKGDTLASVAKAHKFPVSFLREWNNLSKSTIYSGQILKLWNPGVVSS